MSVAKARHGRIGIIGGGILGLTAACELQRRLPGVDVRVFEKEAEIASHQTGRNSGVVHAGLYYVPGSLKARLCVEGSRRLREFCEREDVRYEVCGKVIVALDTQEDERLAEIYRRALANGVPDVTLLGPEELKGIEPNATGVRALYSPHTAIVDFGEVAKRLAGRVERDGGTISLGTKVTSIRQNGDTVWVRTNQGMVVVDGLLNCGGLYADRLARLSGDSAEPRIVPFRGEYLQLVQTRRHLVRGLIYPVPDPRYPFLGIHFTKRIDGEILIGPNAVMALAREGYSWSRIHVAELWESARWPGTLRLAARHWRTGVSEVRRSLSRRLFVAAARRYVPELSANDVQARPSGVRAQALDRDGSLVDDFRITTRGRVVNVRNAPSPAATSSFAIARHITDRLLETLGYRTRR